jgi:enterochelin esterase-like enzyme
MSLRFFRAPALAAAFVFASLAPFAAAQAPAPNHHLFFHVQLPKDHAAASGRLLVFIASADMAKKDAGPDGKVREVETSPFHPEAASVAAREVYDLAPGATVDVDTDGLAFPDGFSHLAPGDYDVQVVLDVDHSFNYSGRGPGDLYSDVAELHIDSSTSDGPTLTLNQVVPTRDPWSIKLPANAPPAMKERAAAMQKMLDAAHANTELVEFLSPSLTAFWGRKTYVRAWALLPPGYREHPQEKYPTVYFTHGFGGTLNGLLNYAAIVNSSMADNQMPPMIWLFLDESSPTGTHEFADSVNNGPWGHALTTEFIPYFESKYRTDGVARSRFLNGHSSGGWATLWLQTRYPTVFGGTWSTSPDPSDFHDFTGVDLYAPDANVYHRPDGSLYPLMRDHGKVEANFETFAKMERVLGPYGGQLASFEWVFSPKGQDGAPEQMFNRDTGAVNPKVVDYWHDHYDIAHLVKTNWPELKPDLDGKIHLIVGTADTFYLDGAAHKLQAVFDGLHAKADFRFLPDRTHFDLYVEGTDRWGLLKDISWEMYAKARPGSHRPEASAAAK